MDINPPLTDERGRDLYTVGGETAWRRTIFRGWVVSLEWFIGKRSAEPMMVIWPANADKEGGAWGICLSSIGKFCAFDANGHVTGGATPELLKEAAEVLVEQFDRAALMVDVHALADVVLQFAPALITEVPTAPREVRLAALGDPLLEVTRIDNGRKVEEVSL